MYTTRLRLTRRHGLEQWVAEVLGYTGRPVVWSLHWSESYAQRWADAALARLMADDSFLHGRRHD